MTEPTSDVSAGAGWRKSSYSGNEGGSCLEVLDGHPTAVPVRDSKVPSGPTLLVPTASWTSFVSALKADPSAL
ncbi:MULTISPECIES: DUF397 domain-containing protein [Streptomyces]|uniref:DUF397 domain-containing protein n=1 Tax=Streptomyces TaxID=1883 RepID=UPI000490D612|nr:DUF397 domain-containing protein [Streptomyces sp. DpondAA-D4]MYY18104.1 DUF397 domain-containing protein [Streptomyces sp. SID4912]SCD39098.1 protein of unknown function [Streptomyces sp. DpondAA-D4]